MSKLLDTDLAKIEPTLKALAAAGWAIKAYVPVLSEGTVGLACVGQKKNDTRFYTITLSSRVDAYAASHVGRFSDLETAIAKLPQAVKEYDAEESFDLVRLS